MSFRGVKASSNMSFGLWVKHPVPKPWTLILPGTARLAGDGEQPMLSYPELLSMPGSAPLLMGSLIYLS